MKFYSTKNQSNKVSFQRALLTGIPQDRGLYMPEYIPDFSKIFDQETQLNFQELSLLIASGFLDKELSSNEIQNIIENSITFEAPNHNIYNNLYCLELFHGPTLAFKDFGARFMARCMQYFIGEAETEINILVATSGDTGSAVAHGFYDVEGINVIILYPKGKVSDIQEKQLTTLDKNIYALEIDGTFDDCQRLVKNAFLDKNLNSKLKLSSANSINIARLIPQSFYYAYSYLQLSNKSIPTIFSVPCGNFGNITAGLIAKKMGVPIDKFIASTNLNNVVPNYMNTGNYNPKESIQTISNAMDVGNPSNMARIMDMYDSVDNLSNDMLSWSFNEKKTSDMIQTIYSQNNYLIDPHSAVAALGIFEYEKLDPKIMNKIFLGTAHPGKFADVVEPIIGKSIDLPKRLERVLSLKKCSMLLNNNYDEFYDYLLTTFQ